MLAHHKKDSTIKQRQVAEELQECWAAVSERPKDPEVLARQALAKGDYVAAEAALRPPLLSYTADGCGPFVQSLYLYVLEYHVFHWRNKQKTTLRELQLVPSMRQAFEEAYAENDTNWQAVSILAYIHLREGRPQRCDALLFEALKFVSNQPLPFVVQSMLYAQWVPPCRLQVVADSSSFLRLDAPKPTGSRDLASAEKLLLQAIKQDKRMVAAHKGLALLHLQSRGDFEVRTVLQARGALGPAARMVWYSNEATCTGARTFVRPAAPPLARSARPTTQEAQDCFRYALTHRQDPDALWWSFQLAEHLGYLAEARKFRAQAEAADPSCAREDFHIQGPHGGRAWMFKQFAAGNAL
jgi:hypothetical protein